MLVEEILSESITRKEAKEVVEKVAKRLELSDVYFTGSLAKKQKGNDIDLVWEYDGNSHLSIKELADRAFDLAFGVAAFGKEKATTADFKIKCDVFVKISDNQRGQLSKNGNLRSVLDIPKREVSEVKYIIETCGGGHAFARGYWNVEMIKGEKIA
jgi:predicted nucleotidyltransferase